MQVFIATYRYKKNERMNSYSFLMINIGLSLAEISLDMSKELFLDSLTFPMFHCIQLLLATSYCLKLL